MKRILVWKLMWGSTAPLGLILKIANNFWSTQNKHTKTINMKVNVWQKHHDEPEMALFNILEDSENICPAEAF